MNNISKSDSYAAAGVDITAGYRAVELLMDGIGNRVVAMQNDQIVDYDIFEALNMKKHIDMNLYKMANIISI